MHKNSDLLRASFYFIFFYFIFFPYIAFLNLNTDLQPYAFILSLVLFLTFIPKVTFVEFLLLVVLIISLLIFLIPPITFNSIRSFINYFSLFFISFVSFRTLKSGRFSVNKIVVSTLVIWFFVSLIQLAYSENFLTSLVADARTTANRGVTGLAVEPTALGIVFIFYIIYILHLKIKYKKLLIMVCVVGVIFLAKSSMATLFLLIMFICYLIFCFNFRVFIPSVILCLSGVGAISLMTGSRLKNIFFSLISNPMDLLLIDASINARFFHIYFSIKGFIANYLFPNGYNSWVGYAQQQTNIYADYVIYEYFGFKGRIMSGYGGAFYELGIFGVLIPLSVSVLLFKLYRAKLNYFFFYAVFVNFIMFTSISIGFPFFGFYIGFLQYLIWQKKTYLKLGEI